MINQILKIKSNSKIDSHSKEVLVKSSAATVVKIFGMITILRVVLYIRSQGQQEALIDFLKQIQYTPLQLQILQPP